MTIEPGRHALPRLRTAAVALMLGTLLLVACDAEDASGNGGDPVGTLAATQAAHAGPQTGQATPQGPVGSADGTDGEDSPGGEDSRPFAAEQRTPDPDRAMAHLRALAEDIGVRAAGTDGEREAATYIRDALRDAGLHAEIEEFEFETRVDSSSVALADGTLFSGFAMQGSPVAEASASAVFAGIGAREDLAAADLRGRVVIFDRGTLTFREKVDLAQSAGAVAVVIVNHETGPFRGSLGGLRTTIPVVAVDGARRDALLDAVGERITVSADLRMHRLTSQNVVASVGGAGCDGYLGAHYDSVPQGPGANDNASGTAVIIEAARANPRPGLCVVAFGAEEVGLFGSQSYVSEHLPEGVRFVLNVDMAGRLDGPIVVGDDALTDAVLAAADAAGAGGVLRAGAFPPFASSDHVSFTAAGVPAVTLNSGDDAEIHTAQDTMERIDPAAVALFLAAVDAALDVLLPVEASPAIP